MLVPAAMRGSITPLPRVRSSSNNAPSLLPPRLVDALRSANSLAIISGAGLSAPAPSSVPTYRGPHGLYTRNENYSALLSGEVLAKHPRATWHVLGKMAAHLFAAECQPNAAHRALADLEAVVDATRGQSRFRFVHLTQNVDGLLARAGCSSHLELHGSLRRVFCLSLGCAFEGPLTEGMVATAVAGEHVPACPRCGKGELRPDVVLFGEPLPSMVVDEWERQLYTPSVADVLVAVGTSGVFPYIQEPLALCNRAGKLSVVVDVAETMLSYMVCVGGASGWVICVGGFVCPVCRCVSGCVLCAR